MVIGAFFLLHISLQCLNFRTALVTGLENVPKGGGQEQPSEYRLTIYRYAIIVSFSKYR